nr:hypothetical protein [Tanacetum cinerariifolium]
MSVSSLSGASSHAFHPSSVRTSTLDSSEIPIIPVETYVVDPASVVHRENHTKNNTITKIEEPAQFPKVEEVGEDTSGLMTCIHEKVEDIAKDTSASTTLTSEEEPEELGNNNSALTTCSVKEGTSIDPCAETTYVTKAQLDATSEGDVDQTSSSSSNASQSSVSQRTEHIIEEFQDPSVPTALGNDIEVPVPQIVTTRIVQVPLLRYFHAFLGDMSLGILIPDKLKGKARQGFFPERLGGAHRGGGGEMRTSVDRPGNTIPTPGRCTGEAMERDGILAGKLGTGYYLGS